MVSELLTFRVMISPVLVIMDIPSYLVKDSGERRYSLTVTGKTTGLEVESFDTINNVKAKTHDKGSIPLEQQTLFFDGEELDDGHSTFAEFCVKNESTLDLVLTWNGLMHIFVNTVNG
ncbi:polyubiquitin-like protein isoform X2, partial [Tanacetum coccineum]